MNWILEPYLLAGTAMICTLIGTVLAIFFAADDDFHKKEKTTPTERTLGAVAIFFGSIFFGVLFVQFLRFAYVGFYLLGVSLQ